MLTYRGFASVVGIVAALMSGIVIVAGGAAVLFLIEEQRFIPALLALALSVGFAMTIALLVPRTNVTLFDGSMPALTLSQSSRFGFPMTTYAVVTPDGETLAELRKSFLSRLGRNRWTIVAGGTTTGRALEESLGRAYRRKLLGKFNRRHEANVDVEFHHLDAATIVRRPDERGEVDILVVKNTVKDTALDRRVLIGLTTLILGSEP